MQNPCWDDFEVIHILGHGSYGTIYKVRKKCKEYFNITYKIIRISSYYRNKTLILIFREQKDLCYQRSGYKQYVREAEFGGIGGDKHNGDRGVGVCGALLRLLRGAQH